MNRNQHLLLTVNRLPGHHGGLKRRLMESCRDDADLAAGLPDYLSRLSPRTRRRFPSTPWRSDQARSIQRQRVFRFGSGMYVLIPAPFHQ